MGVELESKLTFGSMQRTRAFSGAVNQRIGIFES
jgi:hypothetical protein